MSACMYMCIYVYVYIQRCMLGTGCRRSPRSCSEESSKTSSTASKCVHHEVVRARVRASERVVGIWRAKICRYVTVGGTGGVQYREYIVPCICIYVYVPYAYTACD